MPEHLTEHTKDDLIVLLLSFLLKAIYTAQPKVLFIRITVVAAYNSSQHSGMAASVSEKYLCNAIENSVT
eukprot:1822-Heterococcus_DN1.PRE.5